MKYTTGNTAICELSLAVNHSYKDKQGNKKDEVCFVEVTFFGRTAEICGEYLAKGRPVLIEGRLKLDTWEDKETKAKRSKLHVIGDSMTMVGGGAGSGQKSDNGNQTSGATQSQDPEPVASEVGGDQEIPF